MMSAVLFVVNRFGLQTIAHSDGFYDLLSGYEATTFVVGLVGSVCTVVALFWRRDDAWAVRLSLLSLVIFIGGLLSLVWPV
jgi:hypothetical protein